MRQKDPKHPYHNVSQGNYEYFNDVGLDKLIQDVKKVDDYHVQFTLSEPNAAFLADWGWISPLFFPLNTLTRC